MWNADVEVAVILLGIAAVVVGLVWLLGKILPDPTQSEQGREILMYEVEPGIKVEARCGTCVYWINGSCRVLPPQVVPNPSVTGYIREWPETSANDFCGAWTFDSGRYGQVLRDTL